MKKLLLALALSIAYSTSVFAQIVDVGPSFPPNPTYASYTQMTNTTTYLTTSASQLMAGYGANWKITPNVTGIVRFSIQGYVTNNGSSVNCGYNMRYGTVGGGVPAANAALTGSGGTTSEWLASPATLFNPFVVTYQGTGLTPGTQYWFDLTARATTGTCTFTPVTVTADERPN